MSQNASAIPSYRLHHIQHQPELKGLWRGPAWGAIPILAIDRFRPESSDHRPDAQAKLAYSRKGIFGLYRVRDRYVRCVSRQFQDPVYRDSCVELFIQPGGRGYFNFEFNCGGAMLAYFIVDPTRTNEGFMDYRRLTESDAQNVAIYHSQPRVVDPERVLDTTWYLEFFIPFTLIEKYAGPVDLIAGACWRANLYKCGDHTSHPHWAAWSAVDELNFHLPRCFGQIEFMP